jgi:signal transduction histidine kinase
MKLLNNVSYSYKVPLMLSATILITAIIVTAALGWRAYDDLRKDLFRNAVEVGSVLSKSLTAAMKHDDLWLAYQILATARVEKESHHQRLLIVLDNDNRVYVSNEPRRFPVMSRLESQDAELAQIPVEIKRRSSLTPYEYTRQGNDYIYVILPLVDDGVSSGSLIIAYPHALLVPRYQAILTRAAYSTLVVLALLLPAGWLLGKRAVKPLVQLADCLGKVGHEPLNRVNCSLLEGEDEIGQVGVSFRQMLIELQEKQRLESQVIRSEKLAAVGRLAAGMAHEINNPLGGMLNAISTFRHHSQPDAVAEKTLSLLERGLQQIAETVSALLVEARQESHELTHQDIDDVHTLLQPDADKRHIVLVWENPIMKSVELPSTQVRQLLINLTLNALQAAPQRGRVCCQIKRLATALQISVINEGEEIAADKILHLFEPFVHLNANGTGLGLWISYQIVQQLHGEINVESAHGETTFMVTLPLMEVA